MSGIQQQTLAIQTLVSRRCKDVGVSPTELIRRCGYKNISKGLRRLEQLRACNFKRSAGLIAMLPAALEVPVDVIKQAVAESQQFLRESEEAARRAAFRPRTKEELIREIEDRNKLRADTGLPLVSVSHEVKRIYDWELGEKYWHDFRDWSEAHAVLCDKVAEEVLQAFREERGNPAWLPRGLLNGAWAYGDEVRERLQKIWREERSEVQSNASPASRNGT